MVAQLPIGTRIRFIKTLEEGPTDEHPGRTYAVEGGLGTITGHGTKEGYWVKWDGWTSAAFGASDTEFRPLTAEELEKEAQVKAAIEASKDLYEINEHFTRI